MGIPNKVQLITYADSMGGDLKQLGIALDRHFPSLFSVIHILPPFPSSGDRGFAPRTYFEIEPAFGGWDDMDALGKKYGLLVDVMVNHISRYSPQFQDFLRLGRNSVYADYFLTLDKLWPNGIPNPGDIEKIYRRRPRPYSEYHLQNGKTEFVWTTFGSSEPSEQIDLDVTSGGVRRLLKDILAHFASHGIHLIRLDAVGYVIKKMGTSCFLVEPDIYNFLEWIKTEADKSGIDLLCEIHAETGRQYRIAKKGFWIYDFLLPFAVLYVLQTRKSDLLYRLLKDRPYNQFTTLDCHDGIPVKPDLDGWIPADEARRVCKLCERRGARFTRIVPEEHKGPGGFDVHQICGSYYSLVDDDDAYIIARAIQFFVPGIPQVYYMGLLAGENDEAQRRISGDDRGLNRHNFPMREIDTASQKPVVQRLVRLIRFRNSFPAFDGTFSAVQNSEDTAAFSWVKGTARCDLLVCLKQYSGKILYTENGENRVFYI
jgi:sucrose phosphorylase